MIRTPKRWTETCKTCKGSGVTHHQESFDLYTPEEAERELRYRPERLSATEKTQIIQAEDANGNLRESYFCTVRGGATIFGACKEAQILAAVTHQPVAFEFFENMFVIVRPGDGAIDLAKRWWLAVYKETYEETIAKR